MTQEGAKGTLEIKLERKNAAGEVIETTIISPDGTETTIDHTKETN